MNPVTAIVAAVVREIGKWVDYATTSIPGQIGVLIRRFWFKWKLASLGEKLYSETGIEILGANRVKLGTGVYLFRGCMLSAESGSCSIGDSTAIGRNAVIDASSGDLKIGRHVMIAANVVVRASNHRFEDTNQVMQLQGHSPGRIVIEDNVWIGANAVILPNVTIGEHSIVGAGAVVTHDIKAWTIAAGVPAKALRQRR